MFYPCKHNPTKSKPSFLRLLEGRGQTQHCTQSTTHKHLPLVKPSFSSLSTDPFTTPFSDSGPSLSRSKQRTTKDASPATNCQNFAGGKGNFFQAQPPKKEGNIRSSRFPHTTNLKTPFMNHFDKGFWFFYSFLYTFFFFPWRLIP